MHLLVKAKRKAHDRPRNEHSAVDRCHSGQFANDGGLDLFKLLTVSPIAIGIHYCFVENTVDAHDYPDCHEDHKYRLEHKRGAE